MICSKCGAVIPDDRDECLSCFEPVRRPGLLKRFWNWLGSLSSGQISMVRTVNRTTVFRSAGEIPPDLRSKIEQSLRSAAGDPSKHSGTMAVVSGPGAAPELVLDQLPEEIRAQVKRAMDSGQGVYVSGSGAVASGTGAHYTWNWGDPMPPDLVASLVQAFGGAKPQVSVQQQITVRDESGTERTYQSLDEIPPEVRSKIQNMMASAGQQSTGGQGLIDISTEDMPAQIQSLLEQPPNTGDSASSGPPPPGTT